MKTLLTALLAAAFVCGCVARPRVETGGPRLGDSLEVISTKPPTPAVLNLGDKMSVTVHYRIHSADQANIWVRPYTDGKRTPGYAAHPSPAYGKGDGKLVGWFYFDKPAVVDEVRVEMVSVGTKRVMKRTSRKIKARWVEE